MPVAAYAAVALGGALISGFFSSRSESQRQRLSERQSREQNQTAIYLNRLGRQDTLADRRYREEAISGYRSDYTGDRPNAAPALTDPALAGAVNPYGSAGSSGGSPGGRPPSMAKRRVA
jgi:hypothetical protein